MIGRGSGHAGHWREAVAWLGGWLTTVAAGAVAVRALARLAAAHGDPPGRDGAGHGRKPVAH